MFLNRKYRNEKGYRFMDFLHFLNSNWFLKSTSIKIYAMIFIVQLNNKEI